MSIGTCYFCISPLCKTDDCPDRDSNHGLLAFKATALSTSPKRESLWHGRQYIHCPLNVTLRHLLQEGKVSALTPVSNIGPTIIIIVCHIPVGVGDHCSPAIPVPHTARNALWTQPIISLGAHYNYFPKVCLRIVLLLTSVRNLPTVHFFPFL